MYLQRLDGGLSLASIQRVACKLFFGGGGGGGGSRPSLSSQTPNHPSRNDRCQATSYCTIDNNVVPI